MIKDYLVQLRNKLFGVNAVIEQIKELRASSTQLNLEILEAKETKNSLKESNLNLYTTFIQDQTKDPDKFNSVIDERDEMYIFLLEFYKGNKNQAILEYLSTGKQSFNVIKQVCQWHFKDLENISSFLDFASGYGRVTRFLVQEVLPEKIWICDIYTHAVKFQKEQFKVKGINSVPNPRELNLDLKFDCIYVGSLFSHLPPETFIEWLRKLYELLSPNGLLIFSVNDSDRLPSELEIGPEGFLFLLQSESGELDKNEYGTMYVSESFVSKAIQDITENNIYFRKSRGLCSFQDIYVISKNHLIQFETLDISAGPLGCLDRCYLQGKYIIFEGWAIQLDELLQLEDIQIFINNKLVGHCLPSDDRQDVAKAYQNDNFLKSGFRCTVSPSFEVELSDLVIVKGINSKQVEKIFKIDTLESLLAK